MIRCSIITIGDELLIGQTIDTNSAWIAQQLNPLGIAIERRIAVGDTKKDIVAAINECKNHSNLIIVTGGLGPTSDDITKPLLCEYFGGTMIENIEVKNHVVAFFEKRKRVILQSNLNQALVPDVCEILFNEVGTAPGMLFRQDELILASLPGVPFEMQHIMERSVIPMLKTISGDHQIIHKTLITAGEGESFVAERLKSFEASLPSTIKIAYLPNLGIVKIRLSSNSDSAELLSAHFEELKEILANIYVHDEDLSLEKILANLLLERKLTISLAESCTGGGIAQKLTSLSGSSSYMMGGLVAYNTDVKIKQLNVSKSTIEHHSVVSEECALEMANGCLHLFNTDLAFAISGYLEKGENNNTVWMAVTTRNGTSKTHKIHTPYSRSKNSELAITSALNFIRSFVLE